MPIRPRSPTSGCTHGVARMHLQVAERVASKCVELLGGVGFTQIMIFSEPGGHAVHEVFVAQLLSPADLLSMSGKVGLPAWAKRILAMAVIGVGLMYVRLRIMGTQLPVFTR